MKLPCLDQSYSYWCELTGFPPPFPRPFYRPPPADLIKSTTKHGVTVGDLIQEGLSYLDTRTDFWRQQKPIYARVRDRKLMLQRWTRVQKRKPSEMARYLLKSMEEIDMRKCLS